MLTTRYKFAGELAAGKDTLEVAHGGGMGLGHLARVAKTLHGGDFDPSMVEIVRNYYGDRIETQVMDAQSLPFADASLDCVLILEALYFVPDPDLAIREAARVLRPGGKFMVASPNPLYASFNPAPMSTRYYSPLEYETAFNAAGLDCETLCGFPEESGGVKTMALNLLRKAAVTLRLIPDTMEGKERIKRLIYGELPPFPSEVVIGEATPVEPFLPTSSVGDLNKYRVLYAIGTKR